MKRPPKFLKPFWDDIFVNMPLKFIVDLLNFCILCVYWFYVSFLPQIRERIKNVWIYIYVLCMYKFFFAYWQQFTFSQFEIWYYHFEGDGIDHLYTRCNLYVYIYVYICVCIFERKEMTFFLGLNLPYQFMYVQILRCCVENLFVFPTHACQLKEFKEIFLSLSLMKSFVYALLKSHTTKLRILLSGGRQFKMFCFV